MPDSHRRRTRIHGRFEGQLLIQGRDIPVRTENLSLKGMLCAPLDKDQTLDLDLECQVRFILSKDAVPVINGRTVRREGDLVAVDFTGMDDESYAHLRNMVRYSAQDPDAIDDEQAVIPFLE